MQLVRLNALIAKLNEIDNAHFKMRSWLWNIGGGYSLTYHNEGDVPHCKTAGCIAGWVFLGLMTPEERIAARADYNARELDVGVVQKAAMKYLELNEPDSNRLFAPIIHNLSNVTREIAIACLEIIRDTGQINWPAAFEKCGQSREQNWAYGGGAPVPVTLT